MKQEKLPTAEEFFENWFGEKSEEFAQMHVKAALEAANEKAHLRYDNSASSYTNYDYKKQSCANFVVSIHTDSILNAYTNELIK